MTADEKIKEVMGLADELALKAAAYTNQEITKEQLIASRRLLVNKLRELIKDDAPTSLTVKLKVEGIEPLKGLIDLLCQHQGQLPKEIVEYCAKNFGGEDE